MREIDWENEEWKARYLALGTPFGIVMRLVPGSLQRKEEPPMPKERQGWRPERSVRPAA